MDSPIYRHKFEPALLHGHYVKIQDKYYRVVDLRPGFTCEVKLTNLLAPVEFSTKDTKVAIGSKGELLQLRMKVFGPVSIEARFEGAGGDVFGSYGGKIYYIDERVPENMLEYWVFEDQFGWLYLKIIPIMTPAWCKIRWLGFVYYVEEVEKVPEKYFVPPYIGVKRVSR